MAYEAREKCAVAGVMLGEETAPAAAYLYESLYALQHRGTEATGMASKLPEGTLEYHRDLGLVRDVYNPENMARLVGNVAIGHNRYSTFGDKERHHQPVIDEPIGLALAHNGNLPDTGQLEHFLDGHNMLHGRINDSEMMGLAIGQYMRTGKDLRGAIKSVYSLFTGAFSCVAAQDGLMVAFRDPYGIRPLAIGKLDDGWVFSSETCGLDIIGAEYKREVEPGEMVIINEDGLEFEKLAEGTKKLDIFEFVYFARHDSQLYGQRVNEVRRRFGEQLAEQHPIFDNDKNTIVVPVPDTSVPEAEGYAETLGLRHRNAIIKNRYIGRTFMQPHNNMRREQLRRKHNIITEAVDGKDVVMIDDSIVRMNTMPRIVELARQAGARTVNVLVGSPPIRFPDFYGIDTPSQKELVAAQLTVEQMRREIEADYLGFLSLSRMVEATGIPPDKFNLSCFTGEYPIDIGPHNKEIETPVSMEFIE